MAGCIKWTFLKTPGGFWLGPITLTLKIIMDLYLIFWVKIQNLPISTYLVQLILWYITSFRFVFLRQYRRTPVLAICASFRDSSLISSSGGLIITAHTSPHLFYPPPSSCTYNSHMKKRIFSRVFFSFSIIVQCTNFKLSTWDVRHPNRICSDQLLFDETVAQHCIFAVVNCADVALSVFHSPVLTRCRMFLQLWTALSQETAGNVCSLRWHMLAYNE